MTGSAAGELAGREVQPDKEQELMLNLVLYGTSYCHLCEEAEQMLGPYVEAGISNVEVVDIATMDGGIEALGTRIPVITCRETGVTLDWPYSTETLDAWLREQWQATPIKGGPAHG